MTLNINFLAPRHSLLATRHSRLLIATEFIGKFLPFCEVYRAFVQRAADDGALYVQPRQTPQLVKGGDAAGGDDGDAHGPQDPR